MIYRLVSLFLFVTLVACGAAPVAEAPAATSTTLPTASAAPTATIEPTVEPTETQAPTDTPDPTATTRPIRTPHPTREPTVEPTEASVAGLGVSRGEIQFAYQEAPDNFTFEPASESDGQPRLIGKSPDGIATVELKGGADDLTSIGLVLSMPRDDNEAIAGAVEHIIRFCELVVPGWSDCGKWISDNLRAADLQTIETVQGDRKVQLTTADAGEQLTIIVLVEAAR